MSDSQHPERDQRRGRIEALKASARYSAALEPAAAQLAELLGPTGLDSAASEAAVSAALAAARDQQRYHLVWHRAWGVRLRAEVIETTTRLAAVLKGEHALLVWGDAPSVGFAVDVAAALRTLPSHIGPEPDAVGLIRLPSRFLLVSQDYTSGLSLAYDHQAFADQYDLRSWGRYARSVAG